MAECREAGCEELGATSWELGAGGLEPVTEEVALSSKLLAPGSLLLYYPADRTQPLCSRAHSPQPARGNSQPRYSGRGRARRTGRRNRGAATRAQPYRRRADPALSPGCRQGRIGGAGGDDLRPPSDRTPERRAAGI